MNENKKTTKKVDENVGDRNGELLIGKSIWRFYQIGSLVGTIYPL